MTLPVLETVSWANFAAPLTLTALELFSVPSLMTLVPSSSSVPAMVTVPPLMVAVSTISIVPASA
ncbi:hypothetical protein ACVW0I_000964 [Bradyrhizobium sp. LM6.11]